MLPNQGGQLRSETMNKKLYWNLAYPYNHNYTSNNRSNGVNSGSIPRTVNNSSSNTHHVHHQHNNSINHSHLDNRHSSSHHNLSHHHLYRGQPQVNKHPCPIHSPWLSASSAKSNNNVNNNNNKSASSARSSLSSSRSSQESCPDKESILFTNYGLTHGDYMEARVFIRITGKSGLGCSVVKGPSSYPGIFVQTVKDGGIAQESGLEVGDQIIAINGISLEPSEIEFKEAIALIKSTSQMTLTVRKKSGLSLVKQIHTTTNSQSSTTNNSTVYNQGKQSNSVIINNNNNNNNHINSNGLTKQQVKAIVHTPLSANGISKSVAAAAVAVAAANNGTDDIYSSLSSSKHSSELSPPSSSSSASSSSALSSSSEPNRFYPPSEHDYSLSEVESGENDVMKLPKESLTSPISSSLSSCRNGHDTKVINNNYEKISDQRINSAPGSTKLIYDKIRREEERLAEEKKKLESEQKRLQCELEKLEKERKQLENLKPSEDSKSISSSSTVSGSGNQSIVSSSGSSSSSQMGFLDEIKKLAEKRSSENGLITDTLNKTRNLEKIGLKGPKVVIAGQDDENRKRHELLMEEFRAAHSKMFGHGDRKLREVKSHGLIEDKKSTTINSYQQPQQQVSSANGHHGADNLSSSSPSPSSNQSGQPTTVNNQETETSNSNQINGAKNMMITKQPIGQSKSTPIQSTITNSNGETVTILRTTSPCKKSLPPPVPVKKSSTNGGPIVTITSYEANECKNRFFVNGGHSSNGEVISKVTSVTVDGKHIEDSNYPVHSVSNGELPGHIDHRELSAISGNGTRPISIKINLQ